MKKIYAIAAMDEGRVIGARGMIPWSLSEDMKRFKDLTMGHAVLMGRKTYESLPSFAQPLPGRVNMVLTSHPEDLNAPPSVLRYSSIDWAIDAFKKNILGSGSEILWIIGGEQVYQQTLKLWDELYLTIVQGRHDGDAFFPHFEDSFELIEKQIKPKMGFFRYARKADDSIAPTLG